MFFQIRSYIRFLWNSKNEHGVHSPFVFGLLTGCFYDKKQYPAYADLDNYRSLLLQDKNSIQVTDFGAGSKVFRSDKRKVSDIAMTSGITPKRAKLLFRITGYFKPENVLELGTSLGLSTSAMALGHPEAAITTIEGCPETAKTAWKQLEKTKGNVKVVTAVFDVFLAQLPGTAKYDLIYFDGNHRKEATLQYFRQLLPTAANNTVWIFDDIHWSAEMEEAWEIIKNDPKVTVTIDTFQWGFVFFRSEQEKEHFILRS